MATVTVRLVRSFEYRTVKPVVLREVPLERTTGAELKRLVCARVAADKALAPYRARVDSYDALKVHSGSRFAHKGQDLVVDTLDERGWIGNDETLAARGVEDEAEISMFARSDYDVYVAAGAGAGAPRKW